MSFIKKLTRLNVETEGKARVEKDQAKDTAIHPDLQGKYILSFTEHINDDMNTPQVLAVLWGMLKDDMLSAKDKYVLAIAFDTVLGLNLKNMKREKVTVPVEVKKLAKERLKVRLAKDWKKSDELRIRINALGYTIADTKEGYEITKT